MNTIFAIYYNDNCYYIGYTNNLEKRLKDLTKKRCYENALLKNVSEKYLQFLLFFQKHNKNCKVIILEDGLTLSESIQLKNNYLKELKPLYNI